MRVFPPEPVTEEPAYLVCVPERLIPIFCGALQTLEKRDEWATDEDYRAGYQWIVQLQADLMAGCIDKLIQSNDRIYRLLDTALNGTPYTAEIVAGQLEISPPIADVPPASTDATNAMRAHVGRLWHIAENSVNGTTAPAGAGVAGAAALSDDQSVRETLRAMQGIINAGWFGIGGQPATIADLINALRVGTTEDADRIDTALEALQAASSGAVVFNTVRELFADVVSGLGEGAVVATLIASTMSQAALMGLQGAQLDTLIARLDRLITSTDGGADPRPDGNLLAVAEETRDLLTP